MLALAALLLIEICLTMWDFVVEDWVRKPLGGVYPGERVMHGVMGIVYGAGIAYLFPTLRTWWHRQTELVVWSPGSVLLRTVLIVTAVGVLVSGVRDMCAAAGIRGSAWPWSQTAGSAP